MTLYEKLRWLRGEAQMTQAEVAEKLNVTRQTISSYESGRTQPDVEMLKHLAEIYGVSLEELLRAEPSDGGKASRGIPWVLRGTEALILICTLGRSILLWIANRFYIVPEGLVTQELRPILETRFSIMDAARGLESVLLLCGRWLGILLLIRCLQTEVPVKSLWKELGILAAGMLLIPVPWDLADALYGFGNYGTAQVAVLCSATLFLSIGLLVRRLRRKKQ